MKKNYDYTYEVRLRHDEVPAKINSRTGEVKEVIDNRGNPAYKYFNTGEMFTKTYSKAWKLLETQTTSNEYAVAQRLAIRAKAFTNSLQPLSPDTTLRTLSEELGQSKNSIGKIIDKLFSLGVIGKFEVAEAVSASQAELKKYWLFNPYLSFNGKTINKEVADLFSNTFYAKMVEN